MTTASTRRAFLKTGALFAVPLAAPAVAAIRQRVDDETAIRAAHEAWLRDVNRGAVALMASGALVLSIVPDGEPNRVKLAGARASCRFACTLEIERPRPTGGTFAQMALLQRNASTGTERSTMTADYAMREGRWVITTVDVS